MKTKPRAKAAAAPAAQSKEDVQHLITRLGELQRHHLRATTRMNDEIAAITAKYTAELDSCTQQIDSLTQSIQGWCEANRESICGKGKSANLITGEVSWRTNPPKVRISNETVVLDGLRLLGLNQFIRTKTEPNKEAMLADPQAVATVKGISIITGVEVFEVKPFEVQTSEA